MLIETCEEMTHIISMYEKQACVCVQTKMVTIFETVG